METVLIVGGRHDGERVKVEKGKSYVVRYEQPPVRVTPWDQPINEVHLSQWRYIRQFFNTPDRKFSIFVPDEASYADTFQRLLDGYRPRPPHADADR